MKYRLEKKVEGAWHVYGTYTEKSIAQLIQAAVLLSKCGYEMYENLHVVGIDGDGKTHIL